jgi:hypothetical protein
LSVGSADPRAPISRTRVDAARHLIYPEICRSHGAIADFRAKLLALLRAASGASVFILLKGGGPPPKFLGPLGLFGFAAIFGLFMYELRGIEDCVTLRKRAEKIEEQLGISRDESHFRRAPGKLGGLADEVGAGWIVYTAVLTSWLGVAGRGFKLDRPLGFVGLLLPLVVLYLGTMVLALFPPWFVAGRLAGIDPPRAFRKGDPVALRGGEKKGEVDSISKNGERVTVKWLGCGATDEFHKNRLRLRYGIKAWWRRSAGKRPEHPSASPRSC